MTPFKQSLFAAAVGAALLASQPALAQNSLADPAQVQAIVGQLA